MENTNIMKTEELKQLIRNNGLKCTPTRVAVLAYLAEAHRPVAAQEIIRHLKDFAINEVTIYRILDSFVDCKLASRVESVGRRRLYEVHLLDGCQVNHAHFSCSQCGAVSCLEEMGTLQIATMILPAGYQMEQLNLQIQGVCPECSQTRKGDTLR